MFRLGEIIEAVSGQLLSGVPQLRINGVSIDSRTIKKGELFIAIKGTRFDGHSFIPEAVQKGARAIMFSREFLIRSKKSAGSSIPLYLRLQRKKSKAALAKSINEVGLIAVESTRRALGKLASFNRQRFNIPVVAVTGSNGKTTTKDMLAYILSSRTNVLFNPGTQNNLIGISSTLLKLNTSYGIVVLELGTNHFGEIANLTNIAQPGLGIITNIGPAHLENFRNLAGVYKEKLDLLRNLIAPGISILNVDDPWLKRRTKNKRTFGITYGIKNKCDFFAAGVKLTPGKTTEFFVNPALACIKTSLLSRKDRMNSGHRKRIKLNTIGYVNIYNALAAIAAARLLGWSYEIISQRLGSFIFPHGRLNLRKFKGISFIDDTYNANPVSLSEALAALGRSKVKGRRILVMGDMLELGKSAQMLHRQAAAQIACTCDVFISVGRLTRFAVDRLPRLGLSKNYVFTCDNSLQARELLFKTIKPDHRDLILVKGSHLMKMVEVIKKS